MALQMDKRFHKLTLEQVQALDKVLTEVIPIHGRGNFPTLEVRAKDIIRVVKDRLVERDIQVKDIRLNGSTASHVMVRDNGMGYRDLDIIFGVELTQQEDFQVIKEVVLESLRDFLPCGVNRRKITCLTMKEAYVQKMVKVFSEHDRWSLISLSNNRSKTVGLRFVSSLRRQFEFSVDSFQIILDRMLESYWESEKKQGDKFKGLKLHGGRLSDVGPEGRETESQKSYNLREDKEKHSAMAGSSESPCQDEDGIRPEEDFLHPVVECVKEKEEPQEVKQSEGTGLDLTSLEGEEDAEDIDIPSGEDMAFKLHGSNMKEAGQFNRRDYVSTSFPKPSFEDAEPSVTKVCMNPQMKEEELSETKAFKPLSLVHTKKSIEEMIQYQETPQFKADSLIHVCDNASVLQDSHFEFSFPPPAKKTCNTSQDIVSDYCPSPKLQRKISRKNSSKLAIPENVPLLTDLSDLTAQLFPPIEIPKTIQPKPPALQDSEVHYSTTPDSVHRSSRDAETCTSPTYDPSITCQDGKVSKEVLKTKLPDSDITAQSHPRATAMQPTLADQEPRPTDAIGDNTESGSWADLSEENATIIVEAECMYGDFEQAISHLRNHLIATHSPEEIRGGGLLKYSDLLVRSFRPASETEIKSLERYMCSRFFIDFPDVSEQQRKIEAYLQCHFVGNEETSKYDYLMTLRRVIDESTVCLMGHERRQTLNMITVLALRVLGEQNAIPNTANVTCFYQPAPYIADPIFSSYYLAPSQSPLLYHPYPLHIHMQSGLV